MKTADTQGGWDAVVAAAEQEGVVTVWSAADDKVAGRLATAFEKKYPKIKVSMVKLISSEQVTRLGAEISAGRGLDVDMLLSNSDYNFLTGLHQKGLLAKPAGPGAAGYPAADLGVDLAPISVNPYVLVWNTKLLSGPPTYEDLLTPKFKGRVGIPNVPTAAAHQAEYLFLRKELGDDYFKQLAKQAPHIDSAMSVTAQSIASGELLASPTGNAASVQLLKAKDAPIDYQLPPGGTTAFTFYAVAMAKSGHPNAGLLLLDFAMGADGQAILNSDQQAMSVLPNIPGTLQDPKGLVRRDDWASIKQSDLTDTSGWFAATFTR
ncbi:extracellular solute-binding protein [Dactylosporangium sp. NPDC051485]|uniref:ABC transporter substrate-binding protein n=1 Tax=Dactylosporangium sp. NPDC051485 TaxID=3154846 RepID=UPI0034305364